MVIIFFCSIFVNGQLKKNESKSIGRFFFILRVKKKENPQTKLNYGLTKKVRQDRVRCIGG